MGIKLTRESRTSRGLETEVPAVPAVLQAPGIDPANMEIFMQDGALATLLQRSASEQQGEAPQQDLRQALEERSKAAVAASQGEEAVLGALGGVMPWVMGCWSEDALG